MATMSKPLNNKSFYAASNGAQGAPDIAMPPLDYTPATQSAPDPWASQQAQQQQPSNPFGGVPDELPKEVQQEMGQWAQPNQSSSFEEPDRDETSHVEQSVRDEMSRPQQQQTKEDHPNFRSIREAKERAEQERDAMFQQMLSMQREIQKQQQQPQKEEQQEQYDFEDIDSESLVEGKHVKKVANKLRSMEQQIRKYQAVAEETALESRIRTHFPDFEKVVSRENIEMLKSQYPEIAQSIMDTSDNYNKAAAAYSVIKNFGIHKDSPKYEADRAKAIENNQKPRPTAAVSSSRGDSPLSRANSFANGMTDELKEQLRREMNAARRAL
jgi:hypothetical protein